MAKYYLFSDKSKTRDLLKKNNFNKIKVIDENKIKIFLKNLKSKKIILDRLSCSIAYENILKKKVNISTKNDPIYK